MVLFLISDGGRTSVYRSRIGRSCSAFLIRLGSAWRTSCGTKGGWRVQTLKLLSFYNSRYNMRRSYSSFCTLDDLIW